LKLGKREFACQPTFDACFAKVIEIAHPDVKLRCVFHPPGFHPEDACCQWEFFHEDQ
jgi:hypothetical protein